MTTELTPELKARFFAQYWGQKGIFRYRDSEAFGEWNIDVNSMDCIKDDSYITLKPLSAITDEDAIEVAGIMGVKDSDFYTDQFRRYVSGDKYKPETHILNYSDVGKDYIAYFFRNGWYSGRSMWYQFEKLIIVVADYLRSKGYALPFMEYSVDQLIEAGWIKLITEPEQV